MSVTNALAKRLEVEVERDGARHRIVFADNGKVKEKLKKIGAAGPRESGTRVRFWPDPKYFDSPQIVVADIAALLRAKAVLLPGVKFTLGVEKKGKIETQTWHFPEGMKGYFATAVGGSTPVAATFLGESTSPRSRSRTASPRARARRGRSRGRGGRGASASPTST